MNKFNYDNIPNLMKEQPRWVLWALKEKEGKLTKIPLNPKNGKPAKSNDNTTWSNFNDSLVSLEKHRDANGLGFMLGDGFFGVDLDFHDGDNIKDFENIKEKFLSVLKTYTEYSQSGKGIHFICLGNLPQGRRRNGCVEMYDKNRFFALTGSRVENTEHYEVNDCSKEIIELFDTYVDNKKTVSYFAEKMDTLHNLSDIEVVEKAKNSKNGNLFSLLLAGQWQGIYKSQSEADASFCSMLAFWTNKDKAQMNRIFVSSGLMREKWTQKRGELTYGEMTINGAINLCKDTYSSNHNIVEQGEISYNAYTGEVSGQNKKYPLDDTGNAKRFIDKYGDILKYNYDNNAWMVFNGENWTQDTTEIVKGFADKLINEMKKEALDEEDEKLQKELLKNVKHLSSSSGKIAMLKEAQHLDTIACVNADFDKDPFLLNTKSGVIDLKTGKKVVNSQDLMISRNTNCEVSDSEPIRWIKFLNEIFDGNGDKVRYIQRAVGYSLTGLTIEQCLFELTGWGGNGKSVFLNIIEKALGTYALNMQIESILAKNINGGGNANTDIARLKGARFVRTNEPSDGARFNEGLVKQMTGGDTIVARFLYGREFEFKANFKLWIACNSLIKIYGTDNGIWRRMRVIGFYKIFDEKTADKLLEFKLAEELPQILGWAIRGAKLYFTQNGLGECESVKQDTNQYKSDMDLIGSFVSENLNITNNSMDLVKARDLYQAYSNWARNGNEWVMSATKFGIEMSKRLNKVNRSGLILYMGVKLR